MTTGRIVDHDPAAMTFTLPPAHAAWLTRAAGPDNLAVQAQYVGLLARYSRSAAPSRPRVRCSRAELEVTVIRTGTTVSSSL